MQPVLGTPREGLVEADVLEALSLARGALVRHGVDVLDGTDTLTDLVLPVYDEAGSVTWSYRAPDRMVGQSAAVAAVRRRAQLNVPRDAAVNLSASRLRLWQDWRLAKDVTSQVTVDLGPTPYHEVVLADGPVGYWRLGESSGTTATDSSGNGRHGTYVGGVALGTDGALTADSDKAADFDGVDDAVALPASAVPIGQQVSVELWTKNVTSKNGNAFSARAGASTSYRQISAHIPWSDNNVYWDAGGQGSLQRINKLATGVDWAAPHHWVFTLNATTGVMEIFLDGVLWHSGTGKTSPLIASDRFHLGGEPGGSGFADSTLDEFAVYDRALTAAEVKEHYDAGRATLVKRQTITVSEPAWARFYLGVFAVTNPGALVHDGTRTRRTLELADKSYLWANRFLTQPWTVPAGANAVETVRTDLAARFGETRFALPTSTATLPLAITFESGTSLLEAYSRILESAGFDQLTADETGAAATASLATLAGKGAEHTYGAGKGKLLPEGQVEPLLATTPNVVRFSARQGPSLGNTEGNGYRTVRNQSTGPASIDARGGTGVGEVELIVDVDAADQATLDAVAAAEAQRYFAGGGLRWQGRVALNPRHSDRDVISIEHPDLDIYGGQWLVTEWTMPLGPLSSPNNALMRVTAERRVVTS